VVSLSEKYDVSFNREKDQEEGLPPQDKHRNKDISEQISKLKLD